MIVTVQGLDEVGVGDGHIGGMIGIGRIEREGCFQWKSLAHMPLVDSTMLVFSARVSVFNTEYVEQLVVLVNSFTNTWRDQMVHLEGEFKDIRTCLLEHLFTPMPFGYYKRT